MSKLNVSVEELETLSINELYKFQRDLYKEWDEYYKINPSCSVNKSYSDMIDRVHEVILTPKNPKPDERLLANKEIISILSDFIEKNPTLRFGQILHILKLADIDFNEESKLTLETLKVGHE